MERYERQVSIPHWGIHGQAKLQQATVFVAGAGGLGSPLLYYLASAGVGTIIICDHGYVDESNLNRQILYTSNDIGIRKVDLAYKRLKAINPTIRIEIHATLLTSENIDSLASEADIVVDCLDNFETRFILNRFAVRERKPFVHAGIRGFSGQITVIYPPHTPCLACIIPEPPEAEIVPVVGPTAGIIGSMEAMETIKLLIGYSELLTNTLLLFDGETMEFQKITINKNPQCRVCGENA